MVTRSPHPIRDIFSVIKIVLFRSKVTIKEMEQEPTSRYHQLILSNLENNGTLIIGSLTDKIRRLWLDSIQQARVSIFRF